MKQLILLFLLLIVGCTSLRTHQSRLQKVYPPQVNKAPHGWTVYQWQSVIDCAFISGNGSDWSCDSCYIVKANKYHIPIDSFIINYY